MDYKIGQKLGAGSFGSVYAVKTQESGDHVIKFNKKEDMNTNEALRLKTLMEKGYNNFPKMLKYGQENCD